MTTDELIAAWEKEADRLIQAASHFRSQCNKDQRASRIGKAAGLKMAAEALRQYQTTTRETRNELP